MGLDFDGSEARWGYSGFNRFRTKLAKEIGIDLYAMDGFSNEGGLSWGKIIDPIKPLLDHSDCDGFLTPRECKKIAPRLRKLIADWDNDDFDKIQALLLADGMEQCAEENKKLEFI